MRTPVASLRTKNKAWSAQPLVVEPRIPGTLCSTATGGEVCSCHGRPLLRFEIMPMANVKSFENYFHSMQQQNGVPLRYETRQGDGLLVLLCLGQSAAPHQDQGRVVNKVHASHVEFLAQAHELLADRRELELLGQEEKLFPHIIQGNLEGIVAVHPQST